MSAIPWLDPDYIRHLVYDRHLMIKDIVNELENMFPNTRGLSERNIKRFCSDHDIRIRSSIRQDDLNTLVAEAVHEVGGTYGRKMMQGHLQNRYGLLASQRRIAHALRLAQPAYHENRQRGVQNQLNPQSYHAPYFGYNLHLDQNEKIEMYGVVYVTALDGASFFITSCAIMPEKNNITIYKEVFKKTVDAYGMFEKVIIDRGREFFLTLYMQEYLSQSPSRNSGRTPYAQVPSTKNNRVERWWVELNTRVNYPIKHCIIDLELRELIDWTLPHHLFSIGFLARQVATYGAGVTVGAWNLHPIPGHGKPLSYLQTRRTFHVETPSVDHAVHMYHNSGGNLTEEHDVGADLLRGRQDLIQQRDEMFQTQMNHFFPNFNLSFIFSRTANHDYIVFQRAILLHVYLSEQLFNRNILN